MEWILKGLNYAIKPIPSMKGTRIIGVRWGNISILFVVLFFLLIGVSSVVGNVAEVVESKYDELVVHAKNEATKQWQSNYTLIEAMVFEPSNLYDLQAQYLEGEELDRQMTMVIEQNPHIEFQYVPSGSVVKLVARK